jgi:hypothetical protein
MKVATGHIVDGKLMIDGKPLPDGSVITVVQPESPPECQVLSPEDEDELIDSVKQIREGRYITGEELIASLRPSS